MSVKEKVNTFFDKLPFKGMAEKIPAETREKVPVLNKVIPFANQIACGLVVVLLVTAIVACSGSKKDGGSSAKEASGGGSSSKATKAKEAPASDFEYELTADKKGVRIKAYTGKETILVFPATIEDMPVMELGGFVDGELLDMSGLTNIKEVTIPASVTKIGKYLFQQKQSLTKVTISEGLKEISESAFTRSKNLTTINLPNSIERIGDFAFSGCSSFYLKTINLPDNVRTIGQLAFSGCSFLTTINLPANLKEIGPGAFIDCEDLNNIIIPDSLSSIKFLTDDNFYTGVLKDSNEAFKGLGKLPLKTRSRLEDLGYKDGF